MARRVRCDGEAVGLGTHDAVLFRGAVIVAEEVQEPVSEQHRQLVHEGPLRLPSLPAGGGDRDDDVAQKARRDRTEFPVHERECQHGTTAGAA